MGRLRVSKGRQKVPMVKMEKSSNLQVTFSKRRNGLFKKASELCTLCAAELCIIVFSPGKKIYSFGHPSVEAVVERYMTGAPRCNIAGGEHMHILEAHRMVTVRDLNATLTNVQSQIEAEKKRSDGLDVRLAQMRNRCWWARDLDEMSQDQLLQLLEALENLKYKVTCEARDVLAFNGGSAAAVAVDSHHFQYLAGGASSSNPLMMQPQQPPLVSQQPPPVFQTQAYQPLPVVPNLVNQNPLNPVLLQNVNPQAHDLPNQANHMMHLQHPQLMQPSVLLRNPQNQILQNPLGYEANIINQAPGGFDNIGGGYGLGGGFY